MNKVYVVTVATHNEGNFMNMINNKYGIKIRILGWGKKFTGFKMKLELVNGFLKNLDDNDILLFLDGFDVWINGNLNDIVRMLKKKNKKVIFSKHVTCRFTNDYLQKKVFNTCRDDIILNSGLYMGYVKYIKIMLKRALMEKGDDDQRIINSLCNELSFIRIDRDEDLFKNVIDINELKNSNALLIQFPGKPGINRYSRAVKEYYKYFIIEFIFVLIVALSLLFIALIYLKKSIIIKIK